MSMVLYTHGGFSGVMSHYPVFLQAIAMNSLFETLMTRRVAATLAMAVAVAALMLGAAWMKRSVGSESLAASLWQGSILALAVVGLLVPWVALTHPWNIQDSRRAK
jgi:hypothetical protein